MISPMPTQQKPLRRADDKRLNRKALVLIKRLDNPPLELEMGSSNKGVKGIDRGEPSIYNFL